MPIFASSTVTNLGDAAIASGIAGSLITITRVSVGSGTLSGSATPATQSGLVSQQMSLGAPTIVNNNAGQITVNVVLDSANVGSSFYFTELGVWGKVGNGPEQLFVYAVAQGPSYDFIQNATGVSDVQDYIGIPIEVNNLPASSLAVIVGGQIFNSPTVVGKTGIIVTQVLTGGVVTEYDVATDPSKIPGLISGNITLYVSTTGNDSTAQPNNALLPWATFQGALAYLNPYFIKPGTTVTISAAAGAWTSSTPIVVNHPNGNQINIVGQIGSAITSTAGAGSSGTISLTAAIGAFAGIVAGDYITVVSGGSEYATIASGVFVVSTCNSTTLTYATGNAIPSGSVTGQSFSVTKIYSVINFSAGVSGFSVTGNGLGLLQNFALRGNHSGSTSIMGVGINQGSASCVNVGAYGWSDSSTNSSGFSVYGLSSLTLNNCYACVNSNGFLTEILSAVLTATSCIASSNVYGFRNNQSSMTLVSCWSGANTAAGFLVSESATTSLNACSAYYNTNGCECIYNSFVFISVASSIFSSNVKDIVLSIISSFIRVAGTATLYSTVSANVGAVNTLTADGCYFSP